MTFAWPWMFLLLPLPWLAWKFLPPAAPGAALRLPQPVALVHSARRGNTPRWRWLVAICAWALLVCAAARPQQPAPPQAITHTGRALMLAVDCSGSMAIEDMRFGNTVVSRFAAVKAIAQRFIQRRSGDDVGLVLFGTQAYLLTPMTFDVNAVAKQMDGAAVGLAGRETAIGDAIVLAVKHLSALPARARVLVLLTDGVNTAGSVAPLDAAKLAKAAGVRIYTIGVGSSAQAISVFGMQFPAPDNQMDVKVLAQIADTTGGHFFRAADGSQLAQAYRTIDELEPLAAGHSLLRPDHEWYPWPLALAMLLGCALLPWRALRVRASGKGSIRPYVSNEPLTPPDVRHPGESRDPVTFSQRAEMHRRRIPDIATRFRDDEQKQGVRDGERASAGGDVLQGERVPGRGEVSQGARGSVRGEASNHERNLPAEDSPST